MAHHRAFKRDNWGVAKRLMESAGTINEKGFKGITVFHVAARKGQHEIIESLVKLGADWGALDDSERTPCDYLSERGDVLEVD